MGCDKALKPVWVREGDDEVEALSVNLFITNMKIRCVVVYGCQENQTSEKKNIFWKYLDEEVTIANNTESGLVLQFDANLWAGNKIIPGDPRVQNKNAKILRIFC